MQSLTYNDTEISFSKIYFHEVPNHAVIDGFGTTRKMMTKQVSIFCEGFILYSNSATWEKTQKSLLESCKKLTLRSKVGSSWVTIFEVGAAVKDVSNGPRPIACKFLRNTGKAWQVAWSCSTEVPTGRNSNDPLEKAWSVQYTIDERLFSTRTVRGVFRYDMSQVKDIDSEYVRSSIDAHFPSIRDYQRVGVSLSPDWTKGMMGFEIVDRQVYRQTPCVFRKLSFRHRVIAESMGSVNPVHMFAIYAEGHVAVTKRDMYSAIFAILSNYIPVEGTLEQLIWDDYPYEPVVGVTMTVLDMTGGVKIEVPYSDIRAWLMLLEKMNIGLEPPRAYEEKATSTMPPGSLLGMNFRKSSRPLKYCLRTKFAKRREIKRKPERIKSETKVVRAESKITDSLGNTIVSKASRGLVSLVLSADTKNTKTPKSKSTVPPVQRLGIASAAVSAVDTSSSFKSTATLERTSKTASVQYAVPFVIDSGKTTVYLKEADIRQVCNVLGITVRDMVEAVSNGDCSTIAELNEYLASLIAKETGMFKVVLL